MWVWESGRKIDPATGVKKQITALQIATLSFECRFRKISFFSPHGSPFFRFSDHSFQQTEIKIDCRSSRTIILATFASLGYPLSVFKLYSQSPCCLPHWSGGGQGASMPEAWRSLEVRESCLLDLIASECSQLTNLCAGLQRPAVSRTDRRRYSPPQDLGSYAIKLGFHPQRKEEQGRIKEEKSQL